MTLTFGRESVTRQTDTQKMSKLLHCGVLGQCMRMVNLSTYLPSCSWLNATTGKVKAQTVPIEQGREVNSRIAKTDIHIVLHCVANDSICSCDAPLVYITLGCMTGCSLGYRLHDRCGLVNVIIILNT